MQMHWHDLKDEAEQEQAAKHSLTTASSYYYYCAIVDGLQQKEAAISTRHLYPQKSKRLHKFTIQLN